MNFQQLGDYICLHHLKETDYVSADWIHLAHDREDWRDLVNANVLSGAIK